MLVFELFFKRKINESIWQLFINCLFIINSWFWNFDILFKLIEMKKFNIIINFLFFKLFS